MIHVKTIAISATIAGSLGLAALGLGSGLANAAPAPLASQTGFAEYGGWGHGRGPGWDRGPGWGPPPPPPPVYGYGYPGYGYGYGYGAPVDACAQGPLGLVHVCL